MLYRKSFYLSFFFYPCVFNSVSNPIGLGDGEPLDRTFYAISMTLSPQPIECSLVFFSRQAPELFQSLSNLVDEVELQHALLGLLPEAYALEPFRAFLLLFPFIRKDLLF